MILEMPYMMYISNQDDSYEDFCVALNAKARFAAIIIWNQL